MKIHQVLFFCFLSALQDGNTGLTNAVNLYAGAEGGSGSIQCTFTSSGNTQFFCKGECEGGNILIKTDDVTAQSGRYSIRYEDSSSGKRQVSVTIKQLIKSDSGRYRFGLGGSLVPDDYCEFDLKVTDEAPLGVNTSFISAQTEGGSVTYPCFATAYGSRKFFCKGQCHKEENILVETEENRAQRSRYSIEYTKGSAVGLYVTITQLKKSDSGWYQCGYGRPSSPASSYWFLFFVTDAPNTENPNWTSTPPSQSLSSSPGHFWPLGVCVPVILVLVAVVLLLYKLKMRRNITETSDRRKKEMPISYENCPPVPMNEDYQSLDADGMDPDQTYSVLTDTATYDDVGI